MKTIWTTTLMAAALAAPGEQLTVSATVGATVERTFHHESELSLEDMSMLMDGEEPPMPPGGGDMEQEISIETHLVVRDVTLDVKEGRATGIKRSFSEFEGTHSLQMVDPMGGEHGGETVEESQLEGKTVVFERDEDEITTRWADGDDGDDELLDGLTMSMDFDVVLPEEGEAKKGDKWTVPASLLATLARPAGNLHLQPAEGSKAGFGAMPEGPGHPEPDYAGEVEATFTDVREEDGRRLGAIELTIDVLALLDLSEMTAMAAEPPEDAPPGMVMPEIDSVEREMQYEGEGLVLWDLDTGRLQSLEIRCEVRRTETTRMTIQLGDNESEIEQTMVLSGTESWEVSVDE